MRSSATIFKINKKINNFHYDTKILRKQSANSYILSMANGFFVYPGCSHSEFFYTDDTLTPFRPSASLTDNPVYNVKVILLSTTDLEYSMLIIKLLY